MMAPRLLLLILAPAAAFADGGAVQFRSQAGNLLITVFASPTPRAGVPIDISVLLQDHTTLEPVLDATVALEMRNLEANPAREQARNKLLYAAAVTFPTAGKCPVTIVVKRNGSQAEATGVLDIASPRDAISYAGYIAFPPVVVVLFAVRERLVRRRSKDK